jgi:hypothetical protein
MGDERKIQSLRDMPRDIPPPRDLWRGIEAQIAAEPRGAAASPGAEVDAGSASSAGVAGAGGALGAGGAAGARGAVWLRRVGRASGLRVLAAAAVIAALAIGIWIGRAVLPVPGQAAPAGGGLDARHVSAGEAEAIPASLVMDPKYMSQRAQMLQSLQAQIAALPPDARTKVMSSLQTIHDSMQDLEAALGKDPSNALLQELLVNTYQDEMRVLTAVHEAGDAGKGI